MRIPRWFTCLGVRWVIHDVEVHIGLDAEVRKGVNVELEGYGGLENDMLESHNGLNDDWGGSRK